MVGVRPYKGRGGGACSPVAYCLRVQVIIDKLLPLDDVLRVLTVVDWTGHFLFLLIVHLCVNAAAAWELPEKQWEIGVLSPPPRTVGFAVW